MGPQEGRKAGVGGTQLFVGAVVLMVAAAAVYALWLAGSPTLERSKRLDAQRTTDLQSIASFVDAYYNRYGKVPASWDDMRGKNAFDSYALGRVTDPITQEEYAYRATGDAGYELCATFEQPSEPIKPGYASPYGYFGKEWEHGAGSQCFSLDAALRQPHSACSLTAPCAAGQTCAELGDGQGPVCVPAGKECLAAGCSYDKCTVEESYPARVRCAAE